MDEMRKVLSKEEREKNLMRFIFVYELFITCEYKFLNHMMKIIKIMIFILKWIKYQMKLNI